MSARFAWNFPGGLPECPYFHKWVIPIGFGYAIRLHHWHGSDDPRAFHDHSHWFITFVLWGRYTDVSINDDGIYVLDNLKMGSIRFRPAKFKHTVQLGNCKSTITLLITGPEERRWGFWINNKLIKRDKYFVTFGHHPCVEGEEPIRMKPDRSRLPKKVTENV